MILTIFETWPYSRACFLIILLSLLHTYYLVLKLCLCSNRTVVLLLHSVYEDYRELLGYFEGRDAELRDQAVISFVYYSTRC